MCLFLQTHKGVAPPTPFTAIFYHLNAHYFYEYLFNNYHETLIFFIFYLDTLYYNMSCDTFMFVLLIIVIAIYVNRFYNREGFNVDSQNFIYNNKFESADLLQYDGSNNDPSGMYQKPNAPIFDASVDFGVNQNSGTDIFDVRGYNNTRNTETFSDVDNFTEAVDDERLRNKFERTYMLDPSTGPSNVAQYDVSNFMVDKRCCPAQYGVDFMGDDNGSFANRFVAANYSGMNYDSKGVGCPCFTPKAAQFYGSRGGNAV